MASKSSLLLVAAVLAGCANTPGSVPAAGLSPVNQPVVNRTSLVFDAAAPGGVLSGSEAARLDAWFRGLELRYGDSVYVDGDYAGAARAQVAGVAGNYGMLVSAGSPITTGAVAPGTVRVVVTRSVASVPNCPNWSAPSTPNYENKQMSNFGCGVNSGLALMVANPDDLVQGREGSGVSDGMAANKAVEMYRNWPLTGTTTGQGLRPLKDVNSKKGD